MGLMKNELSGAGDCWKANLDKDSLSGRWKFDSSWSELGYQGKGVEWRIIFVDVHVCVHVCAGVCRCVGACVQGTGLSKRNFPAKLPHSTCRRTDYCCCLPSSRFHLYVLYRPNCRWNFWKAYEMAFRIAGQAGELVFQTRQLQMMTGPRTELKAKGHCFLSGSANTRWMALVSLGLCHSAFKLIVSVP